MGRGPASRVVPGRGRVGSLSPDRTGDSPLRGEFGARVQGGNVGGPSGVWAWPKGAGLGVDSPGGGLWAGLWPRTLPFGGESRGRWSPDTDPS